MSNFIPVGGMKTIFFSHDHVNGPLEPQPTIKGDLT